MEQLLAESITDRKVRLNDVSKLMDNLNSTKGSKKSYLATSNLIVANTFLATIFILLLELEKWDGFITGHGEDEEEPCPFGINWAISVFTSCLIVFAYDWFQLKSAKEKIRLIFSGQDVRPKRKFPF